MSTNQCQICFAGTTRRDIRKQKYIFQGHSLVIDQPGTWCDTCGEAILGGSDLAHTSTELSDFRAIVNVIK